MTARSSQIGNENRAEKINFVVVWAKNGLSYK
jgi:hypothetical protein